MHREEVEQEDPLTALVVFVISFGVLLTMALMILRKFKEGLSDSTAQQGVGKAITALQELSTWAPVVVLIAIVAVILYYVRGRQEGEPGTY